MKPKQTTKVRKTKKSPLESDIQSKILKWLREVGLFCWRNNSGFIPVTGKYGHTRRVVVGKSGLPDILGYLPDGTGFGIEVKRSESEDLRSSQIHTQKEFYKTHVYYIVAYSLTQAQDHINSILFKP